MDIEAKIEYGSLKKLAKEMAKQHKVKIGLLANKAGKNGYKGTDYVDENLDLAGLGVVHEFGATINHPGGTPYFINQFGTATFVKKDSLYGQLLIQRGQVTKPHTINIPARPWLSMPIQRNNGKDVMNKFTESAKKLSGGSKSDFVDNITESGDFYSLAMALGIAGVEQIQEAFDTEGFGEWQPNAPQTIARKGSDKPLIDTGRLRGAVTYEVENG